MVRRTWRKGLSLFHRKIFAQQFLLVRGVYKTGTTVVCIRCQALGVAAAANQTCRAVVEMKIVVLTPFAPRVPGYNASCGTRHDVFLAETTFVHPESVLPHPICSENSSENWICLLSINTSVTLKTTLPKRLVARNKRFENVVNFILCFYLMYINTPTEGRGAWR